MPQRIVMDTRARSLTSGIAALVVGLPFFFAGTWAIRLFGPIGVAGGVATFLLLVATVGLIGLTRTSVARALARRVARSSA